MLSQVVDMTYFGHMQLQRSVLPSFLGPPLPFFNVLLLHITVGYMELCILQISKSTMISILSNVSFCERPWPILEVAQSFTVPELPFTS